jgi:predicted nucleic acid-binding protein
MKPNYKIIISDTSCLILLSKIDELDLLNQLFDEIFITSEIQKEFGKKLRLSSNNNSILFK